MSNNKTIYSEIIANAYDKRDNLNNPDNLKFKDELNQILIEIIHQLEQGNLRVAEPLDLKNSQWITNTWVKKAILLRFLINENRLIKGEFSNYFDKIPSRFSNMDLQNMQSIGTRIVPPAYIRSGTYIGKGTIIMPSFINIGAYIDTGTMVDSWATIGSCAQIGKNVHISAGANIGGVLEPMQDQPTIIEDNCFIGANTAIVEGIIIEKNSVIGAGVILGKSTKIYDREKDLVSYGRIPSGSVVVPGNISTTTNNKCSLACAVIVKTVDQNTLAKTQINEILRNIN